MFHSWLADQEEKMEFAKAYSILIGSFSNPEMARKMSESKKFESSEEDFEKSIQMMLDDKEKKGDGKLHRRKRRKRLDG